MNYTFYEASINCVNWCSEQISINQNNVFTENLFVIAMAMGSLLLHNLIWYYDEWLIENTEITRKQIDVIYTASSYFAFVLMAIYIIYYTVF